MDINDFNLLQLLELGLRYPEVGAVNFNVIYIILKTLIKAQGLGRIKPSDEFQREVQRIDGKAQKDAGSADLNKDASDKNNEEAASFQAMKEKLDKMSESVSQLTVVNTDWENEKVQLNSKISSLESEVQQMKNEKESNGKDKRDNGNEEQVSDPKADEDSSADQKVHGERPQDKADDLQQDPLQTQSIKESHEYTGMHVEELTKEVNKKAQLESDVTILKDQIKRLEDYVYSGAYRPERSKARDDEYLKEAIRLTPSHSKSDVSGIDDLKKAMRDYLQASKDPSESTQEGVKETDDEEADIFVEMAEAVRAQAAPRDEKTERRERLRRKFRAAAHTAALAEAARKRVTEKRVARTHGATRMAALQALGEEEEEAEVSEFEVPPPARPTQVSAEVIQASPERATVVSGDEEGARRLKEQIVLYVKSRLDQMELVSFKKLKTVESQVDKLKEELEHTKGQAQELSNKVVSLEKSLLQKEKTLKILQNVANVHDRIIEDLLDKFTKLSESIESMNNVKMTDIKLLQKNFLELSKTTDEDIESLRSFLTDYALKLNDGLEDKTSAFDVDLRLEPLASRLKVLEKLLKELGLKIRFMECQHVAPIDVKKYLHCRDGKRIKPVKKILCPSVTPSILSLSPDEEEMYYQEPNISQQIQADIEKRLQNAAFRDTKRYVERDTQNP